MNGNVYPIIHGNGDSVDTLFDNASARLSAIRDTVKIYRETGPHNRNYYVSQSPEAGDTAHARHWEDMKVLNILLKEAEDMVEHLYWEKLKRQKPGSVL